MRAPPTEPPSFSTETDDEDLEEGSGEDIIIISGLKGGLLSHDKRSSDFVYACFICLCFSVPAEPIRSEGASQDRNVSLCLSQIELSSFTLSLVMITAACVFSGHYHAEGRERRARAPGLFQAPPLHTHQENQGPRGPQGPPGEPGRDGRPVSKPEHHHICLVFTVT